MSQLLRARRLLTGQGWLGGWRGLNAIIPANSPAAWPAGAPWPGHSTSAVRFS